MTSFVAGAELEEAKEIGKSKTEEETWLAQKRQEIDHPRPDI